jgi:hypothetical protein
MTSHRTRLLTFLCLVLACRSTEAQSAAVHLLDYVTTVPAGWESKPPSSSMRLAEFTTPAASGAEAGEVVVYYFGAGQGGGVDANIERWKGQFTDDKGAHPEPTVTKLTGTLLPTTMVELRGAYSRGVGMGGGPAKPDQILLAAVIETPKGNLYAQLHGAAASVRAQRDAFLGFLRQIRQPRPSGVR